MVDPRSPMETPEPEGRQRLYRVRGIVLRRRDLGEADRIVTLLTAERGKLRLVAKGSRRTSSKLAGHLEPFCATRLLVARTRGLDIISQAEMLESFSHLRERESAIAIAGYLAELVDALVPEDERHEAVYDLLFAAYQLINDGGDERLVSHIGEMGLMRVLGYRPELSRCIVCGRDIEAEINGFSVEGGVVCPNCLVGRPDARPISVNALKMLRLIDRGEIQRLLSLRIPADVATEVGDHLARYITRQAGRDSAARRVVAELRLE
ncbi:MAG TPA: DNA repair protein RecO [Thermomicrobiales bacterium]|jgi:DNA repair protein RecO (recombination protein O)|nr:DNA repair protein RecO [Thermomicrobiales bacterium]